MTPPRVPLGGFSVSRVGFGTMRLTGWPHGPRPDRDTALAVLRRAVGLGVNHIDTANYYARDGVAANELIRAALHPYPDDLVIVTKVGALIEGSDIDRAGAENDGLTPDGLRRGVEANLRSLGVDRLDVVNLRVGDHGQPGGSLAAPLQSLVAMREEGLIRHIGVSNVTRDQFAEACEITSIVCVQNGYNVAQRGDDPIVDACSEAGIAFVPFFPLGGYQPLVVPSLNVVANRHGVSASQVALAWLLARSPTMLLIPGTSSPVHLVDNMAAGQLELDPGELASIGQIPH